MDFSLFNLFICVTQIRKPRLKKSRHLNRINFKKIQIHNECIQKNTDVTNAIPKNNLHIKFYPNWTMQNSEFFFFK